MKEKYLPIGTVVLLKSGNKRVMITGFCSTDADGQNIYDYNACAYPEGYIGNDQIYLFNHEQIEKIYHMGFEDEEQKIFEKNLKELVVNFDNQEN